MANYVSYKKLGEEISLMFYVFVQVCLVYCLQIFKHLLLVTIVIPYFIIIYSNITVFIGTKLAVLEVACCMRI